MENGLENKMENKIKYKINKEIGIEIPKEMNSMSFQSFFTFLRKYLQIKYTRRIHIDSILKKCKGKFFKAVNDCLRKCLKINIKKPPQLFITNISIEYNQQFLQFTINNLYNYFSLCPYPMEVILQKDYCAKGKEDFFKYIFLSKIDTLYLSFIESYRYKKEIELMKKQKGIKVAFLHQFVAENFVSYYRYSKPHIKKVLNLGLKIDNNNSNNAKTDNNLVKKQIEKTNLIGNIDPKDKDMNKTKKKIKQYFQIEKLE